MNSGFGELRNRDDTIDIIKGIAISLVILGHVIQYTLMAQNKNFYINEVFKIIYTFHMPLFMFISGYLIFYSTKKRRISEILKSKLLSLFIPYLLWTLIDFSLSIVSLIIRNNEFSIKLLSNKLLNMLIVSPGIWFLFTLFILSNLLMLTVIFEKKLGIKIHLIFIAFFLIIPSSQFCDVYFIKWFYLFFDAGYLFNKYNIKNIITSNSQIKKKLFFLIILTVYLVLVLFWNENDYIYVNKFEFLSNNIFKDALRLIYRYLVGFLGIMIIWKIAEYINFKSAKLKKIFKYFGKYTLDIYLLQRYIIEKGYAVIAVHIIKKLLFTGLTFTLLVIAITVIALVSSVFISNRFLRRCPIINKLALGYRS